MVRPSATAFSISVSVFFALVICVSFQLQRYYLTLLFEVRLEEKISKFVCNSPVTKVSLGQYAGVGPIQVFDRLMPLAGGLGLAVVGVSLLLGK